MKHLISSILFLSLMTFLCGIVYPLSMTGIGQLLFKDEVTGQLISKNERLTGSLSIGQNFEKTEYFWSRPSAISYNPLPSGGSNLSPSALALKKNYEERKNKLMQAHPGEGEPPQDLMFASASGIDPHISVQTAFYQSKRVAKARGMDEKVIIDLINKATNDRQFGFLGEPSVNVLALNLSLDNYRK